MNRLVVANAGWAETIPEWLKDQVKTERELSVFLDALNKGDQKVGDAEACLYLYTASLVAPMSHELSEVYIWLCAKLMKERVKDELPDFMQKKLETGLNPDEERELIFLKQDLWRKRGGKIQSPIADLLSGLKKEFKKREREEHD